MPEKIVETLVKRRSGASVNQFPRRACEREIEGREIFAADWSSEDAAAGNDRSRVGERWKHAFRRAPSGCMRSNSTATG